MAIDLMGQAARVLLSAPSYAETTAGIQKLRSEVVSALSAVSDHESQQAVVFMDMEDRLQRIESVLFHDAAPERLVYPTFDRKVETEEIRAALEIIKSRHPAVKP